jgi:hypothetical protein
MCDDYAICFHSVCHLNFILIFAQKITNYNIKHQLNKRVLTATAIVVLGFVAGRLTVRFLLNMLLGGTMIGGNIL